MAEAAKAFLNDAGRDLYSDGVLLPQLQAANQELEQILEAFGSRIETKVSTAIDVAALATTVTLPSDFLMPIELWERADGSTSEADWTPMTEQSDLVGFMQLPTLGFWSFYNNNINLVGATTAREVLLKYERSLASISGSNSPIDVDKFKRYLSRKTAELAARYIGMNSTLADEISAREVLPAKFDLEHILIRNMQGTRHRRGGSFGTRQGVIVR
jgi:hypothetical protein